MKSEDAGYMQSYDKKSLEELEIKVKQVQCKLQADAEISQKLRQDFELVDRAVRQFDKLDKMIIVICGMLKAGKSTLINLLARSNMASPVDFGVDTTMRPAVVRRGESPEGCIRCYYSDDVDSKKALLQVFDVLRGVELVENPKFSEEKVSLTRQNLQEFLCGELGDGRIQHMKREPLLVAVEIPLKDNAKCLLDNNVMLLDMPGLDSGKAKTAIDGYADVVAESDMMFYVQSSVSPLNCKAKDLLKCVLEHRHSETTYVIQNRMMAQPWRKEDLQLDAQSRQGDKALNELKQCFEEGSVFPSSTGIHYSSMNLGMAYDAFMDGVNDILDLQGVMPDGKKITADLLKERSSFCGFERDVGMILQNSGMRYRVVHCVDDLTKRLANLQEKLNNYTVQKLNPDRIQAESACKSWGRVQQKLKDIQEKGAVAETPQKFVLSVGFESKIKSELKKSWEDVRDRGKDEYRPLNRKGETAPGSVLDRFLESCTEAMCSRLTAIFNECTLNDVEVKLHDGPRSLREFLNESLRIGTFKLCGTAPNDKDEDVDLFQKIETKASAGYEYEHAHKLKNECGEHRFEQLRPSDLDGLGYPFFKKKTFLGIPFGEEQKSISNAYEVLGRLVDDYSQSVRDYVASHGLAMVNTLHETGKERGMKTPLDYIDERMKVEQKTLENIESRLMVVKTSESEIDGLKATVKELC